MPSETDQPQKLPQEALSTEHLDNDQEYVQVILLEPSAPHQENSSLLQSCSIPKRFVFVLMSFLGFQILYMLRVNLSVTIVSMVQSENESQSNSVLVDKFHWDERQQGLVLSSFFWGYVVTQFPGGRLADTFGSKWLFGGGILITSILTVLSPLVARYDYRLFMVCRVLEGAFEGLAYPSIHSMLAKWLPTFERSTMTAIIYSGTHVGTVLTMPIAALLSDSQLFGWPWVFYLFGLFGIVWAVLWYSLVHEKPLDHPKITQRELKMILSNQSDSLQKKHAMPWRNIAKSLPLWALVIAHFGQNWGFYTLLTQLPRYMNSVFKIELTQNGFISALPYLVQAIVACSIGILSDRLYRTERFSLSTLRKTFNTIGFLGPALCLFVIARVEPDSFWTIILLIVALGSNGTVLAGYHITHVDMSPNFASTLMGITNCIANFAGIFAPYTVGLILSTVESNDPDQVLKAWHYVFYLSCVIYIFSATVFVLFGSNHLQSWNDPNDSPKKDAKRIEINTERQPKVSEQHDGLAN